MYFINVILPLNLDKTFTYSVNVEEYKFLQPGMRVTVPFGKTKVYTAMVVEKHTQPPVLYEAKEISQIIDEVPIVNEIQLKHWQWIASYYMCAIGEVFKAALPSGLILESETMISSSHTESDKTLATDEEFLVLEALENKSSITISEISQILNKKNVISIVQSLLAKGLSPMS